MPGSLFVIHAVDGRRNYAQYSGAGDFGIFRFRSDGPIANFEQALSSGIRIRVAVQLKALPSAIKNSVWEFLGTVPLAPELTEPRQYVVWPIGTGQVEVIHVKRDQSVTKRVANISDSDIQDLEVAIAWDPEVELPQRLALDDGWLELSDGWRIGGPVWRERKVAKEGERRFPNSPYYRQRAAVA